MTRRPDDPRRELEDHRRARAAAAASAPQRRRRTRHADRPETAGGPTADELAIATTIVLLLRLARAAQPPA